MISKERKERIQEQKDEYNHEIKEDSRRVLVAKRREGKTQELIDITLKKVSEGRDVLWVSQKSQIEKFTIDMFKTSFFIKDTDTLYNAMERSFLFKNGSKLVFRTMEYLKGASFHPAKYRDYYSILDNAALDSYSFDLISVNGQLYDE